MPLHVSAALTLTSLPVDRYTGNGEETTPTPTTPFSLPLSIILKTAHFLTITPPVITLDEDNNYTAFVAVETNDDAPWTLPSVNPQLSVSHSSGTGRTAVVVQKAENFDWDDEDFHDIPLTAVSTIEPLTIDPLEYPDIDGNYTESDSTDVHVERYTPTRNALIPKQSATPSFNHSLTDFGNAGQWSGLTWNSTVEQLAQFPTLEHTFDRPHRVRSWSLQSVGTQQSGRRSATKLVL